MKLPILPFVFLASAIVCRVSAMPASAQTMQGASLDLALTASPDDYYRTSGYHRDSGPRNRGVSFGAGMGKVRVEFGLPAWHKLRRRPTPNLTVDEQRRALSYEMLYVRNYQVAPRLTLSWLAGGGLTSRVKRQTSVVTKASTGEMLNTRQEDFQRDHVTAVGGLDLEVAVARRIAIVSQVRVRMYPGAFTDTSCCAPQLLTAEPRIGVRWRFH